MVLDLLCSHVLSKGDDAISKRVSSADVADLVLLDLIWGLSLL